MGRSALELRKDVWQPSLATSDVPEEMLDSLTRSPEKRVAYRVDPYFRHGARHLSIGSVLATTFVVLKPDAIAGRRALTVVNELTRSGFTPLDAWSFTFTPSLIRELWRYQYNVASWPRIEVVDLLLPAGESLLLLLRDERWTPGSLPAACRLAAMKGPADPSKRSPSDLRAILDAPTPQFNFLHTADEPADVVRELAAIEVAYGRRILRDVVPSSTLEHDSVKSLIERLYGRVAAHDLDRQASWCRLAASDNNEVSSLARRALHGDNIDWSALLALFPEGQPPAELLWDALSIATAELPHSLPDPRPVIPTFGADASAWRAGSAP